jgi:UDP-glucose 4-epimerase
MSTSLASTARDYGFTGNTVLVTGGAGFIGSHLVDALVQANNVIVLDDLSSGGLENVHPKATFVEGDVRDRDTVQNAMKDADVVFHQAGLVSVEASIENPIASGSVNVDGALTVLDCARQTDTRVVTASSAAVYGQPPEVPIPESAPLRPTSIYGVDKAALDQYTRQFESLYGLPTVTLRYFNVYGPRQSSMYSGVISTFIEQAERGETLTVEGDGNQTRDFVHCSDVVRANILAATTPHTGEAFNVGTGNQVTINGLAETVCEVLETPLDTTTLPARDGDVRASCAETMKATEQLGFEADVSLQEGLETLRPLDGVTP